ncbi:hypothetical protein LPJ61_002902, partial [Coemansia biformis]
ACRAAPPLPAHPRPSIASLQNPITTPPPVAHAEHVPAATPPPTRSAENHYATASFPDNIPPESASAAQAFLSVGHQDYTDRSSIDSIDSSIGARGSGGRAFLVDSTATPPPSVRNAAIRDASANLRCSRFSDNVLNFRDLGISVINSGLGMSHTRERAESVGPMPGVVFRSAELGSACERDVQTLLSKYGIRTIIDLRSELEARANDILAEHYPATMQPTADENSEKLMRTRAAQLRNTIVEVAAHDYEAATRPWERTGESRSRWAHRNSLRYSRSIGNPSNDPVARAMAHLYDPPSDSDTQDVTASQPYVPSFQPATVVAAASPLPSEDAPYTSLAQNAYVWGSETLQTLRAYWDYQWSGLEPAADQESEPRSAPPPPALVLSQPAADDSDKVAPVYAEDQLLAGRPDSASDAGTVASSCPTDSTDLSYCNLPDGAERRSRRRGLRPVDSPAHKALLLPVADGAPTDHEWHRSLDEHIFATRAHTEPMAATRVERAAPHMHSRRSLVLDRSIRASIDGSVARPGARQPHIRNRFDGRRSRYRCNIIGENYRRKCVWAHAPLSTKLKVILRFATFNKAEGIRTIGRDVLAPRGLAGSYEDYIDFCKQEFATVMRIFADPGAYPIMFHCHHGKDRTGIVAMLLLGVLGVDDQIIAADYAQSATNLHPVRKRMELLDMGAVGLPPSFCDSPAPVMLNLLHHIRTNYGSVRGYLRSAGLAAQEIDAIAWCLRGNFYGIANAQSRRGAPRGTNGARGPDRPPDFQPLRFY